MEKSLSIEQNKSFDKIRNVKWYLPLLFEILIIFGIAGCLFSMTSFIIDLPGKSSFYIGTDVLGITICIALYKGCLTGRESNGDMTFLFASLIFSSGALLFFDECRYIWQDIPGMRGIIIALNMLKLLFLPLMVYFFWRYVRFAAELDNYLKPWVIKLIQFGLIPIAVVNFLNVFFTVYFDTDIKDITQDYKSNFIFTVYAFIAVYALIAAVAILIGLRRARISKSHKTVIKMFFGIPLVCSFFSLSLYGAVVFSIVLLYVVIFTEKSNTLAATQTELNTAANIQLSSLPRRFPKKRNFHSTLPWTLQKK